MCVCLCVCLCMVAAPMCLYVCANKATTALIKNAKRREATLRQSAAKLNLEDIDKVKQLKLPDCVSAGVKRSQRRLALLGPTPMVRRRI